MIRFKDEYHHRRWFAQSDPRLKDLCDQIRKENGGPILRFARSHGGLRFKLDCGVVLTRSTVSALERRGWIRQVEPLSTKTRRETWVVTA